MNEITQRVIRQQINDLQSDVRNDMDKATSESRQAEQHLTNSKEYTARAEARLATIEILEASLPKSDDDLIPGDGDNNPNMDN